MTRQKRPGKPAFRSLGNTIGTTYARREIAMRGEVRQGLTQKLNYGLTPNLGRNDIGKRRGSSKVDPERYPPHHVRDGPKSDKWVSKEVEARAELPEEPHELFKRGELYAGPRPGQLHFLN